MTVITKTKLTTVYIHRVWNINRKDYQKTLADVAEACGAHIRFDAEPAQIDLDTATITTVNGQKITADFIIGADGTKLRYFVVLR